LIGFELYLDDGLGGSFTSIDPVLVGSKPFLRSHQAIFSNTLTGRRYRAYLRAINQIGFIDSSLIAVTLADVPAKPSAPPSTILSRTTSKSIYVQYTAPSTDGGSDILSYELQMDDGKGGDFVSLIGGSENYLKLWFIVEGNLNKGTIYRFRYRALNSVGWSLFSDTGFIQAANVPTKPPVPVYVSSTSTSITMHFQ